MSLRFASLYDLPADELQYRVEEWDDRQKCHCLLATSSMGAARAAFEVIVSEKPDVEITLRQKTRVILTNR